MIFKYDPILFDLKVEYDDGDVINDDKNMILVYLKEKKTEVIKVLKKSELTVREYEKIQEQENVTTVEITEKELFELILGNGHDHDNETNGVATVDVSKYKNEHQITGVAQ